MGSWREVPRSAESRLGLVKGTFASPSFDSILIHYGFCPVRLLAVLPERQSRFCPIEIWFRRFRTFPLALPLKSSLSVRPVLVWLCCPTQQPLTKRVSSPLPSPIDLRLVCCTCDTPEVWRCRLATAHKASKQKLFCFNMDQSMISLTIASSGAS